MYSLILCCSPVSCPDSHNYFPPSQLNYVLSSPSPSLSLDHSIFTSVNNALYLPPPPPPPPCSYFFLSLAQSSVNIIETESRDGLII